MKARMHTKYNQYLKIQKDKSLETNREERSNQNKLENKMNKWVTSESLCFMIK